MCSPIKETTTLLALSNVAPMPTKSWFLCRMFTWGRTLCSKMGEGCFRSIQLIDNFVSAHTPLWGKFDLYSYPNQSPSQGDFEAFGHNDIALHKKNCCCPPYLQGKRELNQQVLFTSVLLLVLGYWLEVLGPIDRQASVSFQIKS